MDRLRSLSILLVTAVICLWSVCSSPANATAQEGDQIIVNGVEATLNTDPLQSVIAEKQWKPPQEATIWTSNWRGYLASWEIRDDRFYLLDATYRLNVDNQRGL